MNTTTNTKPVLADTANAFMTAIKAVKRRIIICAGTGCVAGGSLDVRDAFLEQLRALNLTVATELDTSQTADIDVYLSKSGCQGFCQMGPLVTIEPEDILYTKYLSPSINHHRG